jgi:hypothetical protein
VTAVAIDTKPEQTRTTIPTSRGVPAGNPTATTAAGQLIDYDAQPIIVADAYHGVGFMVCQRDTQPVYVADSYHGIGIAVCVLDPHPAGPRRVLADHRHPTAGKEALLSPAPTERTERRSTGPAPAHSAVFARHHQSSPESRQTAMA